MERLGGKEFQFDLVSLAYLKIENMLYCLEIHMENQVNVSDQNNQQIGQNPICQPVQLPEKLKVNHLVIGAVVLICFVIFGLGGYYFGKQSSGNSVTMPNRSLSPTASPTTQKQYGAESIWITSRIAIEFLNGKVLVSVPTGWSRIDCGTSYGFNPVGTVNSVNSCGRDPSAFAINMLPDSPYFYYEHMKNNSNAVISNLKQNLNFGGKKAVQFDQEIMDGQGRGKYKITVIFYSDDAYLYVVLNKLAEESVYQKLLNNIQFK